MDRAQFMRELENLLADIPETERREAMSFMRIILMMPDLRMRLRCFGSLAVRRRLLRLLRLI